ncbi:MAG: biotin/lipoyl-binding protein, partial [Deltaproteobacteria bacterium]
MTSFSSPHWYRVRELRPALRSHVRIHRHHYRGERWYVLQDTATGRNHRFTPAAYHMISQMDGTRTLQEILDATATQLGDDAPGQNDAIFLVARLHAADALRSDVSADEREVFERFTEHQKATRIGRFANPLYLRFPLWDPDAALERFAPRVRGLFTRAGFAAWAGILALGALLAGSHWSELSATSLDAILDPRNLLLLIVTYPLVKALHELGHAIAAKTWGGEVHELGLMLIVGMPVPYVDASASAVFANKRQRMIVGAAGVMVELFVSTLALFAWLAAQPGLVRDVAWNAMLIGGVSTLLFNGNPLLRFDGYYVLSDAIEMPNLAERAQRYLAYLFQHYVFGLPENRRLPIGPGERPWLACYGVAAGAYRLMVGFGIAFLVAGRFFAIGVALALWSVGQRIVAPALRAARALQRDTRVAPNRSRVALGLGATLVFAALVLFVIPLPVWTAAEGLVWPPAHSQIRAGGDGFVLRILVRPGSQVNAGDPLLALDDPLSRARLRGLEARERELLARVQASRIESIVASNVEREELLAVRAELAREQELARALIVTAPSTGTFALPVAENLPGRFVRRGELLGYVANFDQPTVRVVVPQ